MMHAGAKGVAAEGEERESVSFRDLVDVVCQDIADSMTNMATQMFAMVRSQFQTELPKRFGELIELPPEIASFSKLFGPDSFLINSALLWLAKEQVYSLSNFLEIRFLLPDLKPRQSVFRLPTIKFTKEDSEDPQFAKFLMEKFCVIVNHTVDMLITLQFCPVRQQLVLRDRKLMDNLCSTIVHFVREVRAKAALSQREEQSREPSAAAANNRDKVEDEDDDDFVPTKGKKQYL